ncbi:MAG: carboxypeptidase-like regulatory domain-containing protein [Bacteroidia bacterium]|nr:carboxypeptidase-like regulatory domain-containing protein [Bacteroidia bacterium]
MRLYWTALALSLLWAQEESRSQSEVLTPRSSSTRAVSPRPAPKKEVVIVMETISGKVVDKQGAGVADLSIQFIDKVSNKVLGTAKTDAKGGFAAVLPASAEVVILRLTHQGKVSVDKEYKLQELIESETEIVFDP